MKHSLPDNDFVQRSHVGLRLLSYILGFSFIVTMATSSFILFSDYKRGVSQVSHNLNQIQSSYQQSVSYSLWNFDNRQIESQLNGILNFPGVVYVYIESRNKLIQSAGDIYARTDHQYSFELTHQSAAQSYQLGSLYINVDYSGLYDDLKHKAVNILVSQFLKTFSVSIFVLFMVRQLITRRLSTMAEWAGAFNLKNLDQELTFSGNKQRNDELDMVAAAINQMRNTLKLDMIDRQKSQQQLEDTKEQLSVAIDNAALGFCQYYPNQDRLTCNNHFARQLATTQTELESMAHPMDRFRDLIRGIKGPEQRERINQLLYGRISRIHGEFTMVNFRNEKCYFDITFQIIQYNESRPHEVLICIVDKTKEHTASRQAQELAVSLENKVTQRTEELYDEQQRANATIRKLQTRLDRMEADSSSVTQMHFDGLLLKQLEKLSAENEIEATSCLAVYQKYLNISLNDQTTAIDMASCIQSWLRESEPFKDIQTNTKLPFSLMMNENPGLVVFLLEHLFEQEPVLENCRQFELELRVDHDMAFVVATFDLIDGIEETPEHPHVDLSHFIVTSRFRGELSRKLVSPNRLETRYSFSLFPDQMDT